MFNISERLVEKVSQQLHAAPQAHFSAYHPHNPTGCPMWEVSANFQPKQVVQDIDLLLAKTREGLVEEQAEAYKRCQSWRSIRRTEASWIVLCPSTDPFDIVRFDWGDKVGSNANAEYMIGKLRDIDARYGIDVMGAGYQTAEFVLRNVPRGQAAEDLIRELNSWGGSIQEGIANSRMVPFDWEQENPDDLLKNFDFGDGRVALWFD